MAVSFGEASIKCFRDTTYVISKKFRNTSHLSLDSAAGD